MSDDNNKQRPTADDDRRVPDDGAEKGTEPSKPSGRDPRDLLQGLPSFLSEDPDGDGPRRPNWRSILMYLLIAVLIVVAVNTALGGNSPSDVDELATSEFQVAVDEGRVHEATYSARNLTIEGTYWEDEKSVGDEDALKDFTSTWVGTDALSELMSEHPETTYKADVTQTPIWISLLTSFLPMLLLIGVMVYFMSKYDPDGRAMQFGKTKALTNEATRPKVKFDDVAGCDEAIEEIKEIKDYLEDPERYQKIGAKIPRGVLLVGPPGTGKTLLAKAVAGEAGVPFFSISGSGFVEMFVGVGASRVRDLFKNAKEAAPSIIFIDEIDAVGRQRGAGLGGGHDEREQTLNQLLVEMDGFEENESVILIAATNRPDILDPALLRPGRFDRQITVDRPDVKGREKILAVHARNKPLSSDVDLGRIAQLTPGFSGADLGNLMNESALLTARRAKSRIGMTEITESMERVIAGPARKSRVMTEKERKTIAFHESGHALVGHILPEADPVHKISIVPRGQALGYTLSMPDEDRFLQTKNAMLDEIAVLLGGRTAEELFCDDITTGASNDLERATKMARNLVTRYGMSEELGAQVYGEANHEVFLGRDFSEHQDYSQETARRIDAEVTRIIEAAHERARAILAERGDQMRLMASVLLERETVDGKAATALLDNKWDEYLAHEAEDQKAIKDADAVKDAEDEAAKRTEGLEVEGAGAGDAAGAEGAEGAGSPEDASGAASDGRTGA